MGSILSDVEISRLCEDGGAGWAMISPFKPILIKDAEVIGDNGETKQRGIISSGQSSYGYDLTAAGEFKIFSPVNCVEIDPKNFNKLIYVEAILQSDELGEYILIPPNSFALARTIEYMRIPRNITGLMCVKSTYARCGIVSPPTVLEAGWEGHITIEISNTTPLPARVYANEGIAQVLFFSSDVDCLVSYADRTGKYHKQTGITLPKV